VVEADRRVVGIAVRVPGGFKFVCSDPEFRALDSKVFRHARGLASHVADVARARRVADRLH
jgi:hypothetical protein